MVQGDVWNGNGLPVLSAISVPWLLEFAGQLEKVQTDFLVLVLQ